MSDAAFREALRAHRGQMYGSQPYIAHLASVVGVLVDSGFGNDQDVLTAGWLHDVLEDTVFTPDILREPITDDGRGGFQFNRAGQMVWACTGEGKTRLDRNRAIYRKIVAFPDAAAVKLADRIANVEQATPGSRHHLRYLREHEGFGDVIQVRVPQPMWRRLDDALEAKMEALYEAAA